MRKLSLEAKVGVFFLAGLAIFAYAWFRVLDFQLSKGFVLTAKFKSVEGLVTGAPVLISGIKVGAVKRITLDKRTGKALVIMEIRDEYRDRIPEGSRIFVKTKGLLGDKHVVIEPGKPNARKLQPGEEIKLVYEPADAEKIMDTLGFVAQDLKLLTAEARRQIVDQHGAKKLESIIDNTNRVFAAASDLITKNKKALDRTISNSDTVSKDLKDILEKNRGKIDRTLANVDQASEGLNKLVTRNRAKIDVSIDRVEELTANVNKTTGKFNRLAGDLEKVTKQIRSGRGTLGKLVQEETLYREANGLVRDLRMLSSQVQRGPGAVSRLINDPEIYYEARRAIRNMNKTAEDVSEATPISTLAIILGSVFK